MTNRITQALDQGRPMSMHNQTGMAMFCHNLPYPLHWMQEVFSGSQDQIEQRDGYDAAWLSWALRKAHVRWS